MQTTNLILTIAMAAGFAAAQVPDSPGVTVELNGAVLLHRSSVNYPEPVRVKNISGRVTAEVTLDAAGNVADARILSGPEELRRTVLQSVLSWHFAGATAGGQRQVVVSFTPPTGPAESDRQKIQTRMEEFRAKAAEQAKQLEAGRPARMLQSIQIVGLPDAQRDELLARLPLHAGDAITFDTMEKTARIVREFDEHMTVSTMSAAADGGFRLQIGTPDARAAAMRTEVAASTGSTPGRIKVGGNVQQSRLVSQPKPVYPPAAKEVRLQGVVKLDAVIGRDGTVQQLEVISGHPLLVPSAMEAVRQWVYQPTLLNDSPVEVSTQIDVNYTLSQ